jgi:hypothetical protein
MRFIRLYFLYANPLLPMVCKTNFYLDGLRLGLWDMTAAVSLCLLDRFLHSCIVTRLSYLILRCAMQMCEDTLPRCDHRTGDCAALAFTTIPAAERAGVAAGFLKSTPNKPDAGASASAAGKAAGTLGSAHAGQGNDSDGDSLLSSAGGLLGGNNRIPSGFADMSALDAPQGSGYDDGLMSGLEGAAGAGAGADNSYGSAPHMRPTNDTTTGSGSSTGQKGGAQRDEPGGYRARRGSMWRATPALMRAHLAQVQQQHTSSSVCCWE